MAKYDQHCSKCNKTLEVECSIAEYDNQSCPKCGTILSVLFTPTKNIIASPRTFKNTFTELYGKSEKEYIKDNPDAEIISQSRTAMSDRRRKKMEREKSIAEGLDVERHLKAQGKLKKYDVVAGSMPSDV